MLAAGHYDPLPLITHHFSLEEIGEAYRIFANRLDGVLKVAVRP
jgi:alcohol dehydrogenase